MFVDIRSLDTVVFSYLTEYHRKTDELIIETDIELIFFWIKVKVGKYFKISDDFVDSVIEYFKCSLASVDC